MTRWTKEKIEKAVNEFIEKNGRFPTNKEMDENENLPSRSTFPKHFNTTYSKWRKERDHSYSFVDKKFREMSESELKKWLKNRLIEMKTTYVYEYEKLRKRNEPSASFLKSKYNWDQLMREIGLREETYYSIDEVEKKFKDYCHKIGYTPSTSELKEHDNKLLLSILHHFNRYNYFLEKEGYDIVLEYSAVKKTDDELINDYVELCNRLGKLASTKEVSQCEWMVSLDTYLKRFGSIINVRKLAGLDEGRKNKRHYSRKMLKEKATRIIEEHGSNMSAKEFVFRIGCSRGTLFKYFKTNSIREIMRSCEEK